MIQKTVYFRTQEDLDKFNALPNKAEWLHGHLNGQVITGKDYKVATTTLVDKFQNFQHGNKAYGIDDPTYEPME